MLTRQSWRVFFILKLVNGVNNKTKTGKTKNAEIKTRKGGMSQYFNEDSVQIPFTELVVFAKSDSEVLKSVKVGSLIKLSGYSKGKGFSGVMKRWGFHGGPKTHGQSDRSRAPGSIGAQGQGRVIPGKKMPGRAGNKKVTFYTKLLGFDSEKGLVKVKGGVPGSRNSYIIISLPLENEN